MSHDVDDDLRRLFAESADTIEALPGGFDTAVLTAGSKRRRNRRATLGAGATALALVAIAAIWQGPSLVDRTTPPTSNNDIPTKQAVDAWVGSLPRGRDVQAAYTVGTTLHIGDTRVAVIGEPVTRTSTIELQGRTTSGWLARVTNVVDEPPSFSDTFGNIAADGTFTAFANQPKASSFIIAVEPEGTMFAAGRQVRSAATGEVVQTIPDGLIGVVWVDSGLVLYRLGDQEGIDPDPARLWDPSDPEMMPSEVLFPEHGGAEESSGALTPGGLVAVNHAGCTELYEYGLDLELPEVRYCEGQTFALSDSGGVALVRPWTAYDISSGDKSSLPVPSTLIGRFEDYDPRTSSSFFWEDDNNVVFDLEMRSGSATVYVRCTISAQHCERATDALEDFSRPQRLSSID